VSWQGPFFELLEGFDRGFKEIPSGKLPHNYGKSPFLVGESTISMAIFNISYVSLPEGRCDVLR